MEAPAVVEIIESRIELDDSPEFWQNEIRVIQQTEGGTASISQIISTVENAESDIAQNRMPEFRQNEIPITEQIEELSEPCVSEIISMVQSIESDIAQLPIAEQMEGNESVIPPVELAAENVESDIMQINDPEFWHSQVAPIATAEPGTLQVPVGENVVEVEVQSENNNNEAARNEFLIHPTITFDMPSQQLQTIDSVFALGGQEFLLNNCGSKRLVIGLTSPSIPNIKISFKLYDLKNNWNIAFNKKTWDRIVACERQITMCMEHNVITEIFNSHTIRVETFMMYNQCCVQFYDVTETSICMMKPTFLKMMSLKQEVENIYVQLLKSKNNVTKRIKLFVDLSFFHLFKSNNVDNRHNYNWVTLFMNDSSNFLELSNSVASTWAQLGKWIADNELVTDYTNEP